MRITIDIQDLNKIASISTNASLIWGGDFNSHHPLWLSSHSNENGSALYNWYLNNFANLSLSIQSPLNPSRHQGNSHSYLDFFFARTSLQIHYHHAPGNHLKTVPFESDHEGVILFINTKTTTLKQNPILILKTWEIRTGNSSTEKLTMVPITFPY